MPYRAGGGSCGGLTLGRDGNLHQFG